MLRFLTLSMPITHFERSIYDNIVIERLNPFKAWLTSDILWLFVLAIYVENVRFLFLFFVVYKVMRAIFGLKNLVFNMVLCLFANALLAQTDSSLIRIAGFIHSIDSSQQTPYVHIVNMRSGRGVISDTLGVFNTWIKPTDTLVFQCLGFKDYAYVFTESDANDSSYLEVILSPTSYELDVVEIIGLSRRSQVKYDIINMEPPPLTWGQQQIIPGVYRSDYQLIRPDEQPLGMKGFHPVSAVYNAFGKEVHSKTKLAQLKEQDIKDDVIHEKYNRQLLHDFTKYDTNKLDSFTLYLNFNPAFLYAKSQYELFFLIKQKMIPFEFKYQKDSIAMILKGSK